MTGGETGTGAQPGPSLTVPASRSAETSSSRSIEESFRRLALSLPDPLQGIAWTLPHRLGLTKSPRGGFQDFVILDPNRDLPRYAAQGCPPPGGSAAHAEAASPLLVGAPRLGLFRRAHHWGGFCGLLRDRLADGQVAPDPPLLELRDLLFQRWAEALARATEDQALADDVIQDVDRRWRCATRDERAALRGRAIHPARYAGIVTDKLRWISVAAVALLAVAGQHRRARLFQRAYDRFLLSLQCIDDVTDQEEDRTLHGNSVPAALGCTAGALLRTAPKLAMRAAALAEEGEFLWLAAWLGTFARSVDVWQLAGDPVADDLTAIALAGEMDGD